MTLVEGHDVVSSASERRPSVAIVHDYLTQRGGAERVVLAMHRAFPDAPIYTTLFHPKGTFPEFGGLDVRVSPLNRIVPLRKHHRAALPFLAAAVDRIRVDEDIAICSSSGWAHGARMTGTKVVYCYTPARWLYVDGQDNTSGLVSFASGAVMRLIAPPLRRWDRRAAATADRYAAISQVSVDRVVGLTESRPILSCHPWRLT